MICARRMPLRSWSAKAPNPAAAACFWVRRSRPCGRDAQPAPGIDQRSTCRHPDWTGPDDLEIKILELREITGWRVPIYIKVGGARPYFDTTLAVKAGADVVVLDGMQGGTAATQDVFIEHVGSRSGLYPRGGARAARPWICTARCSLFVSGGIRNGADVAKALALGRGCGLHRDGGPDRAGRQ